MNSPEEWYYRLERKDLESRIELVNSIKATRLLFGASPQGSSTPAVQGFRSLDRLSLPNDPPLVLRFTSIDPPTRTAQGFVYWDKIASGARFYDDASDLEDELRTNHPEFSFEFLRETNFNDGVLTIPLTKLAIQNDLRFEEERRSPIERRSDSVPASIDRRVQERRQKERRLQQQEYFEEAF